MPFSPLRTELERVWRRKMELKTVAAALGVDRPLLSSSLSAGGGSRVPARKMHSITSPNSADAAAIGASTCDRATHIIPVPVHPKVSPPRLDIAPPLWLVRTAEGVYTSMYDACKTVGWVRFNGDLTRFSFVRWNRGNAGRRPLDTKPPIVAPSASGRCSP